MSNEMNPLDQLKALEQMRLQEAQEREANAQTVIMQGGPVDGQDGKLFNPSLSEVHIPQQSVEAPGIVDAVHVYERTGLTDAQDRWVFKYKISKVPVFELKNFDKKENSTTEENAEVPDLSNLVDEEKSDS